MGWMDGWMDGQRATSTVEAIGWVWSVQGVIEHVLGIILGIKSKKRLRPDGYKFGVIRPERGTRSASSGRLRAVGAGD